MWEEFEPLATTVLYEGHVLYPYRPSAIKNRQRWNFGTLFPPSVDGESSTLRLEVLVESPAPPRGAVRLCFLRGDTVEQIECRLGEQHTFLTAGIAGHLAAAIAPSGPDLWKLTVAAHNQTALDAGSREAALPCAMLSAQLRCRLDAGAFISAQDPPASLAGAARDCHCLGVYPVLVGTPGSRAHLLASPLILEDYARVAPQSSGDFCDAVEMDELLTLRVLTLAPAEQDEIRLAGGTGKAILDRCLATAPDGAPLELHGGRADGLQPWDPFAQPPSSVRCGDAELRVGHRVRLHPRPGPDLFTSLLDNRTARVQAIEQDLEGTVHLAVVVDDDPGADLGEARQSGHRFFFALSEVEPL